MRTRTLVIALVGGGLLLLAVLMWSLRGALATRAPASVSSRNVAKEIGERISLQPEVNTIALADRYRNLSTTLPEVTDDSGAFLDDGDQWGKWGATQVDDDAADVDELVAILREPARAINGDVVQQVFNKEVKDRVTAAGCVSGSPAIEYDPYAITALTPPALRFMKYHELGHVALHVDCTPKLRLKVGYTEREADCWAVAMLASSGSDGRDAIVAASQFFFQRNDPKSGRYESSRARARYLRRGCV